MFYKSLEVIVMISAVATSNITNHTTFPSIGSPMTFSCEVEVLRDNGYGKLAYTKKLADVSKT